MYDYLVVTDPDREVPQMTPDKAKEVFKTFFRWLCTKPAKATAIVTLVFVTGVNSLPAVTQNLQHTLAEAQTSGTTLAMSLPRPSTVQATAIADSVIDGQGSTDTAKANPKGTKIEPAAVEARVKVASANVFKYNVSSQSAEDIAKNPQFTLADSHLFAVGIAASFVGTPYQFDGVGPSTFDCSGLVRYVYANFGILLEHSVHAQVQSGKRIKDSQARPGDLVVFNDQSHVGIYAGNGMMYHAPKPGAKVELAPFDPKGSFFVRVTG